MVQKNVLVRMERLVFEQLKSWNIIHFLSQDNSRLELDFVIQYKSEMLPIEVKAEGNVRANSLTRMLKENTNYPLYSIPYAGLQDSHTDGDI